MDLQTGEKCAKCGYDLTGLRSLGQCPECGGLYDKVRRLGIHSKSAVSHTSGEVLVGKITRIGCGVALACAGLMVITVGGLASLLTQTFRGVAIGAFIGGVFAMAAMVVLLGLREQK